MFVSHVQASGVFHWVCHLYCVVQFWLWPPSFVTLSFQEMSFQRCINCIDIDEHPPLGVYILQSKYSERKWWMQVRSDLLSCVLYTKQSWKWDQNVKTKTMTKTKTIRPRPRPVWDRSCHKTGGLRPEDWYQGCRALTFALARLSCLLVVSDFLWWIKTFKTSCHFVLVW